MNPIIKFFHELMNPHCAHCIEQRDIELEHERDNIRCRSCEMVERQIAVVNDLNRELVNKLTKINEQPIVATNEVSPRPLRRGPIPFSMIRQQLEQESRTKAQALHNAALPDSVDNDTSINKLEQQVMNASVARTAETGIKQ